VKNIAQKFPILYKLNTYGNILENHLIVIVIFLIYLYTIFSIDRSFMNLFTLLLLLVLLGIYLDRGLKSLIKFWNIIAVYQALVLLVLVIF